MYERLVHFRPAWDKTKDPRGNFGVRGMTILFAVRGLHGAIAWEVTTSWMLPHVYEAWKEQGLPERIHKPFAGAILLHSIRHHPTEAGQACDLVHTGKCYGGALTGYLYGDELLARLIAEGDTPVWEKLEEEYVKAFGKKE